MATLDGNLVQRTRCAYFRGGEPFACNKQGRAAVSQRSPKTPMGRYGGFLDSPHHAAANLARRGTGADRPAAAIANAVFHATGRRVRGLPIRIGHLL